MFKVSLRIYSLLICVCLLFPTPTFGYDRTIEDGRKVKLDYTLRVDGTVLESTVGKEALSYIHGEGKLIPGLAAALVGLKEGDRKTIVIPPEQAYGKMDEASYRRVKRSVLPFDFQPTPGMVVELKAEDDEVVPAIVWEVYLDEILLNFNHPLAGKTLEFDVVVVGIR